jgi:hypothetical protein
LGPVLCKTIIQAEIKKKENLRKEEKEGKKGKQIAATKWKIFNGFKKNPKSCSLKNFFEIKKGSQVIWSKMNWPKTFLPTEEFAAVRNELLTAEIYNSKNCEINPRL